MSFITIDSKLHAFLLWEVAVDFVHWFAIGICFLSYGTFFLFYKRAPSAELGGHGFREIY